MRQVYISPVLAAPPTQSSPQLLLAGRHLMAQEEVNAQNTTIYDDHVASGWVLRSLAAETQSGTVQASSWTNTQGAGIDGSNATCIMLQPAVCHMSQH